MSLLLSEMLLGATKEFGSFSAVLNASSTAATINYPAGILAGDLIVLIDRSGNSTSAAASVTPAGFTSISSYTSNNLAGGGFTYFRLNSSFRIATGTETGSITGMNGGTSNAKVMIVFRSTAGTKISTAVASDEGFNSVTATTVTLNTTTSGLPASTILFGAVVASATKTISTFTQTPTNFSGSSTVIPYLSVDFEFFPNAITSNYSQTATMTGGGTNWMGTTHFGITVS